MASEDLDHPPASPDSAVQQFVDTQWREAMRAAREGREAIQRVYPELVEHLPETAGSHIAAALADFIRASTALHRAGRHVLGQAVYDEYLETSTERAIGRKP